MEPGDFVFLSGGVSDSHVDSGGKAGYPVFPDLLEAGVSRSGENGALALADHAGQSACEDQPLHVSDGAQYSGGSLAFAVQRTFGTEAGSD